MDAPTLTTYIDEAQAALESFLTQLLNRDDVALTVETPEDTTADAAQAELADALVVGAPNFALQLPEAIVSLISEAILGQAMDIDEEGVDDLMSEMTGQGYGAVRTQLAELDVTIAEDVPFTVAAPDEPFTDLPADALWNAPFTLTVGDDTFSGRIFLEQDRSESNETEVTTESAAEEAKSSAATQQQQQPAGGSAPERSSAASDASNGDPVEVAPAGFSELGSETLGQAAQNQSNFEMLAEVELDVRVELGRRQLPLADVLQLTS